MGIFLGLGSNLGRKSDNLKKAIVLLNECGVRTIKQSKVHNTKAVSKVPQPDFANQVIEVATKHSPEKLLKIIKLIERQMGRDRTRPKRKGAELPRPGAQRPDRRLDVEQFHYVQQFRPPRRRLRGAGRRAGNVEETPDVR